jgi:hypothetical protein
MNSKVWLTTFGVAAFLVIAGTGFYAFSNFGKYQEALGTWDAKVSTIESLEKRVPYPNEENAKAVEELVGSYRTSVASLSETLKSFQRPLNQELANTEFQQRVKKRVEDFRAFSQENGFEIIAENGFHLGFDAYAEVVPTQELVPELDYELEAIDYLLRKLVASGSKTMTSFERDPIPGEPGGLEKKEDGVVQKYPVRIRFQGSHEVLQTFINDLANDRQFFYVVRVLKVKNENEEGPPKLTPEEGGTSFARFENPVTKEIASTEKLDEWRADGASEADVEEKAKAAGFIKADQDARVLMGQEKLNVFLVVDISRFLSPEEQEALAPKPEAKKGR